MESSCFRLNLLVRVRPKLFDMRLKTQIANDITLRAVSLQVGGIRPNNTVFGEHQRVILNQ